MIYILAVFLPPLALLLNGQIFSTVLNFAMIVTCILLGLAFPVLWLVPSAHAVIAISMSRENRRHRRVVLILFLGTVLGAYVGLQLTTERYDAEASAADSSDSSLRYCSCRFPCAGNSLSSSRWRNSERVGGKSR